GHNKLSLFLLPGEPGQVFSGCCQGLVNEYGNTGLEERFGHGNMLVRIVPGQDYCVHLAGHVLKLVHDMLDLNGPGNTFRYPAVLRPDVRDAGAADTERITVRFEVGRYGRVPDPGDLLSVKASVDNGRPGVGMRVPGAHPDHSYFHHNHPFL